MRMVKKIRLRLLTRSGLGFEKDVVSCYLPTKEGSLCVLYNHAPMLCALGEGEIKYRLAESGKAETYKLSGGVAEVSHNDIIILCSDSLAGKNNQ